MPGEAKASGLVVAEWLRQKRIEAPELSIENGSGLSRTDRASAATIAALLRSAWASPVMPELVASLPVFAVDGTFRMKTRRRHRPGAREGRHADRRAGHRRATCATRGASAGSW